VTPKQIFFQTLEATLDQGSLLRVRYAYRLAKDVHRNQKRKQPNAVGDSRYFTHPREVALISMRFSLDVDLIVACLLHDVLEDGNDPRDAAEIELFLGVVVIRTVRMVSKVPKAGYHERFALYSDWRARWVKACDRLHNLQTLPDDPVFRAKQIAETVTVYLPLFEEMCDMVPAEYAHGARSLVTEIRALVGSN
jgi:(p)ppGpp synthase/HD superfamily hydrolase